MVIASANSNIISVLTKYTAIGGYILPCCWPVDGKCGCGRNHQGKNIGKAPLLEHGYQDKRRTQTIFGIQGFIREFKTPNFGGHFPNRIILDIDKPKGGFDSLTKLQHDIGDLPRTLTDLTGSGGLHIFYHLPEAYRWISASELPGYPGIDVRIHAYVILPPSLHVCGNRYSIYLDLPVVEAPESLLSIFKKPQDIPRTAVNPGEPITLNQDCWLIKRAGSYRFYGDTADQIMRKLRIDLERCPTLDANHPYTEKDLQRMIGQADKWAAGTEGKYSGTHGDWQSMAESGLIVKGGIRL